MKKGKIIQRVLIISMVLVLITGCASSNKNDNNDTDNTTGKTDALQEGMTGPVSEDDLSEGGELTFAALSEPRSLDPAVTIASGATGGIEMINIYGTLMRHDTEKREAIPYMAKSLESNESFDTWTLNLRDEVMFSNGEPMDASAVKKSQQRYAAKESPEAQLWNTNVVDIETPDHLTVQYKLKNSWPGFDNMFTAGVGMIVAEESDSGEDFTPIGAGPFTLQDWAPQDSMELEANSKYWDGDPHLDAFEVVYLGSQETGLDAQRQGEVDAVFLRDPDMNREALDEKSAGYVSMVAASHVAVINDSEERPGSDPKIRKAMQLAIDPQQIMERAYEIGMGSSDLFQEYSHWNSEIAGLAYDPKKASNLVEEAKNNGFDGKIELTDSGVGAAQNRALALKAQLEAVGFTVETDLKRSTADLNSEVSVKQNYDISFWALNLREADPFTKMYEIMHSAGAQTFGMYTSDEMDALLEEFQETNDGDKQLDVMSRIQEQLNEDNPFITFGASAEVTVWDPTVVHGIVGASSSMFLVDKAWVTR